MTKVFEDIPCVEFVLRIILDKPDIKVIESRPQADLQNLQGRSVRLDVFATDSKGRKYNIEIQRGDKGAGVKRARYNSALVDANVTVPGDEYEKLPEAYVIFITENDVLGDGLPIYNIIRVIKETNKPFDDESNIVYVNASAKGRGKLAKLMEDFRCKNADRMNNKILADRVRYFKETEKGVSTMCRAMEELCDESKAEGKAEGRAEDIKNVMKNANMTFEAALKVLGIPLSKKAKYSKLLAAKE